MERFKIGVIRVVTINDQQKMSLHGRLLEKYFPKFETESYCIPDQGNGIYDQTTFERALPKLISLGEEISRDKDGLIISCAGDPAVPELKKILRIPVTGAGFPTAVHSLNFGAAVGVLGIEESAPENYIKVLGEKMVGYRKPETVVNTNDLQTTSGRESLFQAARALKEIGAEVVALACTGMSTIGIAPLVEELIDIPVIDPVIAEGLYMYERCLANARRGEQ